MPRYDMLAIDLDGTLLDPRGEVSRPNRNAVASARAAGLSVIVCTGRGLAESDRAIRAIDQREPVIVASGAIIACPVKLKTLHRFTLEHALVVSATKTLLNSGYAVLVLKDRLAVGYDYLVVQGEQGHEIDPVTRWWFKQMRVKVRYAKSIAEDEHPQHTVRVGACGTSSRFKPIRQSIIHDHGDRVTVQHFQAVTSRNHAKGLAQGETLDVFEVFDPRANKWSALTHLASEHGIDPARICAIGDEINDEVMVARAGLGVAMENACDKVKSAAKRHTSSNSNDGVAHAIDNILDGTW